MSQHRYASDADLRSSASQDCLTICKGTDNSVRYVAIASDYALQSLLGRGGFGSVYLASRLTDNLPVAIKRVYGAKVTRWHTLDGRPVPFEVLVLLRLRDVDGVIQFMHYYAHSGDIYIVCAQPVGTIVDLFDYISARGTLEECVARHLFRQVVAAVMACHERGVWHRDLKDENVLVDTTSGRVTLIDFGSATFTQCQPFTQFDGTHIYAPPEWLRDGQYEGAAACVWSLGALLYAMVCGQAPFETRAEIEHALPLFRRQLSRAVRNLIRRCLARQPECRLQLAAVTDHEWMAGDGGWAGEAGLSGCPPSADTSSCGGSGAHVWAGGTRDCLDGASGCRRPAQMDGRQDVEAGCGKRVSRAAECVCVLRRTSSSST